MTTHPFDLQRFEKQMHFIAEIDKMKLVFRRTLIMDSSRHENDAEHSWHLAMMAVVLEEYAREPVNMLRVLKMVIAHDLIEVYAGDTFAYDVKGNIDKEQREKEAADKLYALLPTEQGTELRTLWEEFDAMNTADSLFAASLDRLQPYYHNLMTNGHTWVEGNVTRTQVTKRAEPIKKCMPDIYHWMEEHINESITKGWIRDE